MIQFTNRPALHDVSDHELSDWLTACAAIYNYRIGQLSYTFLDQESIRDINRRFLNHDYATDIITFDYSAGGQIKGDIYIGSVEVSANAQKFGQSEFDEYCRVMVHGLLHLIGFDDHSEREKQEMRQNEDKCLLLRPKKLIDR